MSEHFHQLWLNWLGQLLGRGYHHIVHIIIVTGSWIKMCWVSVIEPSPISWLAIGADWVNFDTFATLLKQSIEFDSVEYFVNSHRILALCTCFPSGNLMVELSPLQCAHSLSARSDSLNIDIPDGIGFLFSQDWVSSSPSSLWSSYATDLKGFNRSAPAWDSRLPNFYTGQNSTRSLLCSTRCQPALHAEASCMLATFTSPSHEAGLIWCTFCSTPAASLMPWSCRWHGPWSHSGCLDRIAWHLTASEVWLERLYVLTFTL